MCLHIAALHICSPRACLPGATAASATTTGLLQSIWLVHLNLLQPSCRSQRMLAHNEEDGDGSARFSPPANCPINTSRPPCFTAQHVTVSV